MPDISELQLRAWHKLFFPHSDTQQQQLKLKNRAHEVKTPLRIIFHSHIWLIPCDTIKLVILWHYIFHYKHHQVYFLIQNKKKSRNASPEPPEPIFLSDSCVERYFFLHVHKEEERNPSSYQSQKHVFYTSKRHDVFSEDWFVTTNLRYYIHKIHPSPVDFIFLHFWFCLQLVFILFLASLTPLWFEMCCRTENWLNSVDICCICSMQLLFKAALISIFNI